MKNGFHIISIYVSIFLGTIVVANNSALAQNTTTSIFVGPDTQPQDFVLKDRDLVLRDAANRLRIRMDAQTGNIVVFNNRGKVVALSEALGANLSLGGHGRGGDLLLLPRSADQRKPVDASVHIDGSTGQQRLGGAGTNGELALVNSAGAPSVLLNGKNGRLTLAGPSDRIAASGNSRDTLGIDPATNLQPTIVLNGSSGEIRADRVILDWSSSGRSRGIDSASLYIRSENPALSLLDNSGGNEQGWMVQSSRAGRLIFSPGNTNRLNDKSLTLERSGGLCVGFCKQDPNQSDSDGSSLKIEDNSISAQKWVAGTTDIAPGVFDSRLHLNRDGGSVQMFAEKPAAEKITFSPGRLSIGASTGETNNAQLVVSGTTVTKELIVKPTGWADDVFDADYSLMSEVELQAFLMANRHLPGIQSEASVMADGLSVNEFNTNLLRNVEELTLRVIQQRVALDNMRASHKREIEAISFVHSQQLADIEQAIAKLEKAGEGE